ncbi:MAG: alpha-hydroxy-acid oxidizing enzyme [Variovorax sp.]|nr:alpha-hydroxy-acid oxidizing enzyme [Variovorax sp.]
MASQGIPISVDDDRPTASDRNAGVAAVVPRALRRVLSLDDLEAAARAHLPRPVFSFVASAAEDGRSFRSNRDSFAEYGLVTRVLRDVSRRSQAVSLFGKTWASPFGIAPLGLSALSAYRGDLTLARAAGTANIPMVLSGSSLIPMEEVAAEGTGAWFQAYLPGDTPRTVALIERVARAGFTTLVVTLDTPVAANRENNVRAGFSIPLRPNLRLAWDGVSHPRWLLGTFLQTLVRHGMPHFENNYATRGVPILSPNVLRSYSERGHIGWEHLALLRRMWPGTLIVKGVLSHEDARLAREHGADGIIVSNHGGRQLDGAMSPLRVLPGIVAACPDLPVMIDGGIRRGTDVIKALALGARFVFLGRPFIFAAALAGEPGVRHAIDILHTEIDRDMGLMGLNTLAEVTPACLMRLSPPASAI